MHLRAHGGRVLIAVSERINSLRLTDFESSIEDYNIVYSKIICAAYLCTPLQMHILDECQQHRVRETTKEYFQGYYFGL